MQMKRKVLIVGAVLVLAGTAGYLMQDNEAVWAVTEAKPPHSPKPAGVVSVANSTETAGLLREPPALTLPTPAPMPRAVPEAVVAIALPEAVETPTLQASSCDMRLDIAAQPAAMIGLALSAPCRPDERVVVLHDGLAITGQTTGSGALFMSLPAMRQDVEVSVLFTGGARIEAQLEVPEASSFQRFAVQWQGTDAFQIHAFENGADYGAPGHVSAANPHLPVEGIPLAGGFMTVLGNDQVLHPMLAEVYTYPPRSADVRIVVESAVTAMTCGREILGETLANGVGRTVSTDLTLAMPDCDAVSDILVLKDLVSDIKMAAVN